MSGKADIHFKNGKRIERADQVTYLGGEITTKADRGIEINSRISKALATCMKLKTFWRKIAERGLDTKMRVGPLYFKFQSRRWAAGPMIYTFSRLLPTFYP